MKKITLQLRSKEQAVKIIERTLSELLQSFDITQKKSDRRYIKLILSEDQSIIIKMLNHYYSEQEYILSAYLISTKCPATPLLSTCINDLTKEDAVQNLSNIIVEFAFHYKTDSIIVEHCLDESMKIKFLVRDITEYDNYVILDYIFKIMNKYNDCMVLKLDYLINVGCPEEISCNYFMKIQYANIFEQDYYSFNVIDPITKNNEYINLSQEEAEDFINNTLNIMRKIATTAIPEKHEKGRLLMLELAEECYNV